MLKPANPFVLAAAAVLAGALSLPPAAEESPRPAPQPAPSADTAVASGSAPKIGPAPLSDAQIEADRKLNALLLTSGGIQGQTDLCLKLAWDPNEADAALREAAIRRLRTSDPRVVADGIVEMIDAALPPARIGMIELMADLYRGLGGRHPFLDATMCGQIRSSNLDVAATAITVCSRLGIAESYLPMREIASQPRHALNKRAIEGIAQLGDPRAVGFLASLIQSGSAPREEVFQALARIGRPAALLLKTKSDDPDPAVRGLAIEALIQISTAEDLTALYAYVQKYRPEGDLRKRLYDRIAELEASQFERPLRND